MRSLFLSILFLSALAFGCSRQPVYPLTAVSAADAVIDIASLKPDTPRFFTYRYQGKNINFFVIRMEQKIVSFLDACASCYPHKRGYSSQDGTVTCRFCDMKFSIYKLEQGLGGCYPIRIEGRIDEGKYLIPLSALQKEAGKF